MINVKEKRKRIVRQTKRKGATVSGLTGRKQGLKGGKEKGGS